MANSIGPISQSKTCFFCLINDCEIITSCGHEMCRNCFDNYITSMKQYPVSCFACYNVLSDDECRQNITGSVAASFEGTRSHFLCSKLTSNKFQCFNLDCNGTFENHTGSTIEYFVCAECNMKTCLLCSALHRDDETCQDWELNNADLIKSRKRMAKENKQQIKIGIAMKCPECGFIVQKLEGCDGVLCPSCHTGLCFKLKMRRWGPDGEGDNSGGCKCRMDGKTRCHPRCKGCFVHQPMNMCRNLVNQQMLINLFYS